jgi:hypothetical protein
MRIPLFRALAIVAVAAAAAACAGDAPTAATAPDGPSLNGGALGATANCVPYSYYPSITYDCTAVASGGSGSGYSFSWSGGASEYYDQGGTSKAYVVCYKYSGSPHGTLSVYGTVTDGSNTTAWFSASRSC